MSNYRVKKIGDRWHMQRCNVWNRWANLSSHRTEELAYKAMRKAERKEMMV